MKTRGYDIKNTAHENPEAASVAGCFPRTHHRLMILVNSPGNDAHYWPLDHAEWHGLTPTDLVFPFFVFIVGVSLVFLVVEEAGRRAFRAPLFLPRWLNGPSSYLASDFF